MQEMRFLFAHYYELLPADITQQHIINYISFIIKAHGAGRQKCHQVAQSCSFYFKYVYPTPFIVPAAFYPRKTHKLPQVFSVAQLQQLLSVITNQKHLMMVSLFYGTGLRMNELRNIKLSDVDSKSYQIKVVAGKGGKDRFTILPKHLLEPLRNYYKAVRPPVYLFEGQRKGHPMHERSIQHFMQTYITRIGLGGKDFSAHTLRHSFATHLLEEFRPPETDARLLIKINIKNQCLAMLVMPEQMPLCCYCRLLQPQAALAQNPLFKQHLRWSPNKHYRLLHSDSFIFVVHQM